ncbi:hypothetical protein B0A50_08465 [Salinomyces thailandicus]|uniref:Uncharacterized protein n=1 Tax=Salinomyces thailandicus TaxID=706561 RepID=A0A4U0TJZ2_9PEZI|nr:hypothetical protein B0A50_08465 [Salinomyces thailandica]
MAISAEESSTTLEAPRPIFIRNRRSSQTLRTGVGMPTYTIQKDVPWMDQHRDSVISSLNSDDYPASDGGHSQAASVGKPASQQIPDHASPQQEGLDQGPQARSARLPIFKQVRNILQKPMTNRPQSSVAWDEHSGEMSESGKPPQVKPSAYVSPWEGAFKSGKKAPERKEKEKLSKRRSLSSLKALGGGSLLKDDEVKPTPPLKAGRCSPRVVSPSSSSHSDKAPMPLSTTSRQPPQSIPTISTPKTRSRKPVPSSISPRQTENIPPNSQLQQSPSAKSDWTDVAASEGDPGGKSHFSWTTVAPSEAPGRPSRDTGVSKSPHLLGSVEGEEPSSRFSWSTTATQPQQQQPPQAIHPAFRQPQQAREPVPTVPSRHNSAAHTPTTYQTERGPPVQSILSRHRPIQRMDRDEWTRTPPSRIKHEGIRSSSATPTSTTTYTETHANTSSPSSSNPFTATTTSKPLPLPPSRASTSPHATHLQQLLAKEKDLAHQRRNVQKTLADLEKIEKASPMEVDWSTVRDAKLKLGVQRRLLEAVVLEEREVGIGIARARRREEEEGGEGGGLWVRRVTG